MIGSSPQASYGGDFVDGTNMIVQGKAGNNTVEDDEFDDQKSIVSSSYYSTLSKRTSMVSFFTTKSRLTTDSRESRALYADEPRTPWQQTLYEKRLLLSKFDETNWSGRGQHAEFSPDEFNLVNALLIPSGILGHSATAVVEKVRCKRIMLARKKIKCNWRLKREDAVEEVAHLQRLNHAHIIRCVGTYVMGTHLSILLYPATEHNLESFLDEYVGLSRLVDSQNEAWLPMYRDIGNFPICLVQAIGFMHEHLVKHMDVKPTNLLVQRKHHSGAISYKIYLADFGIARSYDTAADAETESSTPFSRTYAAPEVVFQEMRGFSADIFSLGCVVLEIYAALINKRLDFIEVRRRNPNGDISYQANIVPLSHYMERTRRSQFAFPAMAFWMMHEDSRFRPTARELVSSYDVLKPAPCCIAGSESFEAESVPFHKAHAYYSEGKQ